MRRWVWRVPVVVVVCCGLGALMAWSLVATIGWWVAGELVAISLIACWLPDGDPARGSVMLTKSLPWPTLTLAAGGLFTVLDTVTALLLSVAAFVAAGEAGWLGGRGREGTVVRRRAARRRSAAYARAASEAVIAPVDTDPEEGVLEVTDELTDADLCMAWRSSYVALDRATSPIGKLRAVEIREVLLDELERRNAAGLEAWFRSGARAAGWPDRYLRDVRPTQEPGMR